MRKLLIDEIAELLAKSQDTQVATTGGSYGKAGDILRREGVVGNVLDYGAGRGHGTPYLPGNAVSYEPNPREGYTPDFTESPDQTFDGIANLNVLNVVPEPVRSEIAQDILGKLNKDGVAAIGARSYSDVMNAKNPELLDDGGIITSRGTYQYGFGGENESLVDYLNRQAENFPDKEFEITKEPLAATGATVKRLQSLLAPALIGGLAAGQSEDADAMFFGLAAKGANKAGAKAAHDVFKEHMRLDPNIFTDLDTLIESGAMQSRAAREAGNSKQGWFIGVDGKPRYEINDKNASIDRSFDKDVARKLIDAIGDNERQHVSVPLPMMLNHDPLYRGYPELRDTKLHLWKPGSRVLGDSAAGWTHPVEGQPMGELHLNLGGVLDGDRNESVKSLLHEAQHAIQNKEGFARGASAATALEDLHNYVAMPYKHGGGNMMPRDDIVEGKIDGFYKVLEKRDEGDKYSSFMDQLAYYMSAGETEARAVEKRLRMPPSLRASDDGHPYGDMTMPNDYNMLDMIVNPGRVRRGERTLFDMIEMLTDPRQQ